jgi:hypothetical protein
MNLLLRTFISNTSSFDLQRKYGARFAPNLSHPLRSKYNKIK